MDPKRKRLYLIIIVVCFSLSAVVLLWSKFGSFGGSEPEVVLPENIVSPISQPGNSKTGFTSPPVFPANEDFQTEVLESSDYKSLNPYTILDITGQLGRTDPFSSY